MFDAIAGVLDKVDAAVAESAGVVSEDDLDGVTRLRDDIRSRLSYPEDILVAALVGGTGSGKSSLFNAVADEEIAEVGGIRPTTSEPLALVSDESAPLVAPYLEELGVETRLREQMIPWLCLIDLPDTDSVATEHRHTVENLIPRVDLIIWVVDPEKYGDAALHTRYIESLIDYQAQFLFVLNQMDRVPERDRRAIQDDFAKTLRESGVEAPTVVGTVAAPLAGPSQGVERLISALDSQRSPASPASRKHLVDLQAIAGTLVEVTGGARSVDFEDRWDKARFAIAEAIAIGDTARAGHELGVFLEELGRDVGGTSGDAIRGRSLDAADVVERASALIRPGPAVSSSRRFGRFSRRPKSVPPVAPASRDVITGVSEFLQVEVGYPVHELLAKRARSHASMVDLYLAVSDLVSSVA